MLTIDEAILLNQLAQGIVDGAQGQAWFEGGSLSDQRRLLVGLNALVLQASPRPKDATRAISEASLRETLTPCVLITKPPLDVQLAKLAQLPERELSVVFRLVIKLLAIADHRRRTEKELDLVNHWWHRDLSDPKVVEEIRRTFG